MSERSFTANCIADDGTIWAIYFMVECIADAENIVTKLNLNITEEGVCEMVEVVCPNIH